MRFRSVAAGLLALLSSHALAFDATKSRSYPSPDLYRPNIDQLTSHGPLNCAPGSVCDISGMSVGGGALNSGVLPSILTRLTPAQVADVRSGAASLDLAPTLNAAFNACMPGLPAPTFEFPPGVYGIKSELLASTCPIHVVLNAGATIVQTGGFASGVKLRGIVHFKGAASGSSLTGPGTIDGNRASLVSAYIALPKAAQVNGLYVMSSTWDCVLVEGADNIVVSGPTLKNCMSNAVNHSGGNASRFTDLKIQDSTVATFGNVNDGNTWSNITEKNIGNVVNGIAIPWFQYQNVFLDQKGLKFSNVSLDGWTTLIKDGTSAAPGSRIGDPFGGAFFFQRLSNSRIGGLVAKNYSYSDGRATPAGWGLFCDNCVATTVDGISIAGAYWGAELFAPQDVSFANFTLDGQYNVAAVAGYDGSRGLSIKPSGQLRGVASLNNDSSYDHYNNMPANGLTIANGTVKRFLDGVTFMTGNTSISNVRSVANRSDGFKFWANRNGASYPNSPTFPVDNIVGTGLFAAYNDGNGLQIIDGTNIRLGITAKNNGQNFPKTFSATGIQLPAGFGGAKKRISFSAWTAEDDQSAPISATLSFVPGTVSGGTYRLVASASGQLHLGQNITVVNGGGSGSNIAGQITDITDDIVTLAVSGAPTFNDAACRVALAGTVSVPSGSNLLTGSGTAFTTAVTGPAYLLAGGQYLKVGGVISDTQMQMDTAAAAAISGVSAQLIQCAAQGIPSQQTGFAAPADPNIADISLGNPADYRAVGNTVAQVNLAPASQYNDLTTYTPTFTSSGGTGVALSGGARYKLDGKTLFISGYIQVGYTAAPSVVRFTLPNGMVSNGGTTLSAYNSDVNTPAFIFGNASNTLTIAPLPNGSLGTASGQYIQFNGSVQVQ